MCCQPLLTRPKRKARSCTIFDAKAPSVAPKSESKVLIMMGSVQLLVEKSLRRDDDSPSIQHLTSHPSHHHPTLPPNPHLTPSDIPNVFPEFRFQGRNAVMCSRSFHRQFSEIGWNRGEGGGAAGKGIGLVKLPR